MTDFTSSINSSGLEAKYNPTSNLVSDLIPGAVASVVDFGASVWNSLPGTEEVATSDLLRNINQDALRVYQENPDTIHTASFIGGMFVPTGLALKGMKMARSGVKGVNWFSEAGRASDVAKVGEAFKTAGSASKAYRESTRSMYAKSAVNNAIDAVAAEVALLSTMNAHPLMEDYMEDPGKNFAISLLGGSVLGAGIGHIADRFVLKGVTGKIAEEAFGTATSLERPVYPNMTSTLQLQSHSLNVKNMEAYMRDAAKAGKDVSNDEVIRVVDKFKTQNAVAKEQVFEALVSPEIRELPASIKQTMLQQIENAPEMAGVDAIRFLTSSEIHGTLALKPKIAGIGDTPVLTKMKLDKATGNMEEKSVKSVFFPNINGYAPPSAAKHYAPGVSLVGTPTEAVKFVGKTSHKYPNSDASLELLMKPSAELEASVIGSILRYSNKPDIVDVAYISNSDSIGLTAALSTIRGTPGKTVKIHDVSENAKMLFEAKLISTGPAPVKYAEKLYEIANTSTVRKKNHINPTLDDTVSADAKRLIESWVAGDAWKMQEGATRFFAKGFSKIGAKAEADPVAKAFQSIYESTASQNFRKQLRTIADNEGNIYLYRGWKTSKIKGVSPIESMTTDYTKALEFARSAGTEGRVNLYKVNVDDVVAAIEDTVGGTSKNQTEILVAASARVPVSSLDTQGKELLSSGTIPSMKLQTTMPALPHKNVGEQELVNLIKLQKADDIDNLKALGIPAASIAIKTNTPIQIVEAYMAQGSSGAAVLEEVLEKAKGIPGLENIDFRTGNAIHSPQTAEAALDLTKKPLVLSGNQRKLNTFTEAHAKMDDKRIRDISKQFIALSLAGSKSELAKEWGDWLNKYSVAIDIFEQKIGKVNNEFAGGRFVTSSDMYTRMMDELGTIANAMGKQSLKMSNSQIGRTVEPIRKAMETLSKDPAALLEFNVANNLLDSLKGWRGLQVDKKLVTNQTGEMVEVPIMRIVQKETKVGLDGKKIEVLTPVKYQGEEFVIRSSSVQQTLETMQEKGRELKALADVRARILGTSDINDIGFWKPTFNPVNKHIAYVHDKLTNKTTMLRSGNKESFTEMVSAYRKMLKDTGNTTTEVIEKGTEQKLWSLQNSRLDTIQMELADTSMLKKGSASAAIVPSGLNVLGELVGGYEHYILSQTRNLMDVSLPDIGYMLRRMSAVNVEGWEGMAKDTLTKQTRAPKDAAASIRNIMFGQNGLGEYEGWKTVNQSFENVLSVATRTVQTIWESATGPMKMGMFGMKKELSPDKLAKLDYEKFAKDLEAKGIVNPYKVFDDEAAKMFGLSKLEDSPDISKRLVYGGNAFAATLALRVGELAQPLVNIMSMPILTHLASAQKMPEHFLGRKLATANVSPVQIMYEGMRHMNSPMSKNLAKEWEKAGYFDAMISEANDTLQKIRSFDRDAIATAEKALNSNFIRIMSKPADWSEAFSRKYMMHTGAVLAKRLYPELDDAGVTLFARDFMDKTIGNFHAPQRPVFFQGTLGVALGLFQTYSLTLAQNMYRHLEMKNYKALGKAALTQSTIFGIGSLPGFRPISDAIGEEFSDDHTDLVTGTFRAASTPIAESILYGLPSQVGVGTHTRGDSNFRFPGADGIVAVNFAKQVTGAVMSMANAVGNADKTVPQAFLEAMSLQNISRPLARGAELASGYSVTRNGNTVQTPEEVWTMGGVAARVLATRPIEEIKLRDAMHLNQFYGSVDYENRQSLMSTLKTKLRAGTLSDEDIAKASNEYLRKGGTPTGWRSAYRTLLATEDYTGKEVLANKLRMDSPLNYMIDSLDGY